MIRTQINIITDPIFSERASPVSFAGPKRKRDLTISVRDLPRIDVVLVSHNHYDHMDINTLKALEKHFHPVFIVPLQNGHILKKAGIHTIVELDWWESHTVQQTHITLTPAEHWSARGLWDKNKSLWGSFWIQENNLKIYHAGDTGYGDHFAKIHHKLGSPDISLLPIGAYEPRWFMKDQHMNPEEAVKAHRDLKSALSIAMHYGTFQLTDEGFEDPLIELQQSLKNNHIDEKHFKTLHFGAALPLQQL